jgi:gluconolactonase
MQVSHRAGSNPLKSFHVEETVVGRIGRELQRPECILAERDGTLWAADAQGGVMRIATDGTQHLVMQESHARIEIAADPSKNLLSGTLPNGLAFANNGDLLIANFGTDRLERMTRGGETRVLLDSVDGVRLGKVNFVLRDSRDRLWITISTTVNPWSQAVDSTLADGYIVLLGSNGPRIVADGFRFTNEIRLDAREEWLYVAETTGKPITRLRVRSDGSLVGREIYGPSNLGAGLVDGIAFDAYGNLWATMIFADRLVAITPEGDVLELMNDGDPAATARFEAAFAAATAVPSEIMLACGGPTGNLLTSLTFGGPDLSTVFLGGLRSTDIPFFKSPVPGLPMIHW